MAIWRVNSPVFVRSRLFCVYSWKNTSSSLEDLSPLVTRRPKNCYSFRVLFSFFSFFLFYFGEKIKMKIYSFKGLFSFFFLFYFTAAFSFFIYFSYALQHQSSLFHFPFLFLIIFWEKRNFTAYVFTFFFFFPFYLVKKINFTFSRFLLNSFLEIPTRVTCFSTFKK